MSLKVAIDISPLKTAHSVRGIGTYTRNLIESIQKLELSKINIDFLEIQNTVNSQKTYDIIHYPYFDLFSHTLPIRKRSKTIVTIHDVIPLVFPEHYPPGLKGQLNFWLQKIALKNLHTVIAVSYHSKRDIVKYLKYPEERIKVVYSAPSDVFGTTLTLAKKNEIIKKYNLPCQFILYVGDVNWNKNVLGLAQACKNLNTPLVIIGKQAVQTDFDKNHIENQSYVELLKQYGNDPSVIRLGFVEEKDLTVIYNLASVYCQPSFYEGFGLPILEAMACGCPVVSSNTSSLPEICGEAAIFFDPEKNEQIENSLTRVLLDKKLRDNLIKKGFLQVKKFSWQKTAEETIKIYEQVALDATNL